MTTQNPSTAPAPALTGDRVRADVAQLLGCDPADLDADEDLLDRGLDSIRLMTLVERWRRAGASGLEFADLAEQPVLRRWQELVVPHP
ncbi:phosphopantetheine-binding protein [Kineococcus esterisolvens]|uniref:phosphopantetheine-binding protein n=1 Tax=unclassified Kineococcus TaxID=2621656 RepID=UPI003D7D1CE5